MSREGEHGMDISTFYALFSATCFTLLGLWWTVLQLNSSWIGNEDERRAVGGVYLTFLLPALMGLFAQVGGAETPVIWRLSFVIVAVVGCYSTLRLLRVLRTASERRPQTKYVATLAIYLLVAVIGAYPEIAEPFDITAIQMEAILLILLVLVGHGLVWDFMVRRPPGGEHMRGSDT
jgi:cation transport ATPase